MSTSQITYVWSRRIRFFHWCNVLSIFMLLAIGLIIFNAKSLGISVEGKILLKTIHVTIGYVFTINLLLRILWGFIGKGYERWRQTLPFTSNYLAELKDYKNNKTQQYKGHNPAGKLMILTLLFFMTVQMISGLVIAGTDIYYPPFGNYFAQSIAIDDNKLEEIKPYSKINVNEKAYQEMRAFRKPFIPAHVYSFYALLLLIPLHVIAIFIVERKRKEGLVSAMINGYKYLKK